MHGYLSISGCIYFGIREPLFIALRTVKKISGAFTEIEVVEFDELRIFSLLIGSMMVMMMRK